MRKFRPRKAKKIPPKDATLRPTPPLHGSEKEYVPVALKTVPPVRPAAPRIVIPSKPGTSGSVLQVPQIAALPRPQLHTLVPPGLPSPSTTNQSPWRPIIRPYPPATKPPSNVNSKTAHRPQGPPLPRSSPSANPLPQVHEREPTPPPLTPVPSSAHPRPRMPAPSNVTVPSSLPTPLVSTSRRATGAASLATPSAAAPIDAHFETLTAMACFQLLP